MSDASFQQLALAELDAVYRLAVHLARSPQEAEDFVQDTYLRAFRSSDTFTLAEHGIRPWLFKILHNVIHTSGSKKQREQAAVDGLCLQTSEARDGAEPSWVDLSNLDWDRVDQRLKAAIADLPLSNRIVFLLSALEGLKYREIAEVTGVPVGTVMSRLSRARRTLAERLASLGHEHGLNRRAIEESEEAAGSSS